MESEASNQINNDLDYTKWFFYATMCHVCKRFGAGVPLKRCGGCWMIAYCGEEHRDQHWEEHKPLCKAIRGALRKYNMDYRCKTAEERLDQKQTFAQRVSSRLDRPLNASEMQMFFFPRECLVCHEWNNKSLESCLKCAASFCKNDKDGIEHRDICASLELCLCTNLFSVRERNSPAALNLPYYLQYISRTSTFQNMKDLIKACMNIQSDSEMSCNARATLDSEYLTDPLTLFYAMRLLNDVPKSTDLVVHILGPRKCEEIGWEILPRLIGTLVSVQVILIGPELCKLNLLHDCDNCMSREKKCLTFEYHDMLYENYVDSSSFVKPDLVVGFNQGIHEHELGSERETWAPSIRLIAKQNCPFIFTSVTLQNLEEGTNKINKILDKEVDYLYSGKNPFASINPFRTVGPEYVLYMNEYVIIYRSLCS